MPLTTLDPAPALVVFDLQKGIVSGSVADVVPNAAALAKAFRQHDLHFCGVVIRGQAAGHVLHVRSEDLPADLREVEHARSCRPGLVCLVARIFDQYHWPRFDLGGNPPEPDGTIAGIYEAGSTLA